MISNIKNAAKTLCNTEVESECGHKTKIKGEIKYFKAKFEDGDKEATTSLTLKLNGKGEVTNCLSCIEEAAIRCAWCGGTILPGEPITLYMSAKEDFTPPEYAVEYNPDNRKKSSYVGCIRWDCADTGADVCGNWGFDKQVHRKQSPIEIALATGKPVITNL